MSMRNSFDHINPRNYRLNTIQSAYSFRRQQLSMRIHVTATLITFYGYLSFITCVDLDLTADDTWFLRLQYY